MYIYFAEVQTIQKENRNENKPYKYKVLYRTRTIRPTIVLLEYDSRCIVKLLHLFALRL
jgi:hypothetical protein